MKNTDWYELLENEFSSKYFKDMLMKIEEERKKYVIYPPKEQVFNAFLKTSYKNTKVVILGQDPYHNENQANGLAFSVNSGIKMPPSLVNIFKEIDNQYSCGISTNGDLSFWAKQGILLLNTTLTVRENSPNSHEDFGWKIFTDKVIKVLNDKESPVVFIFWGKNAINKKKFITNSSHLVLTSPHPSPLSAYRGFFGNSHFIKTNEFLKSHNILEIDWKN